LGVVVTDQLFPQQPIIIASRSDVIADAIRDGILAGTFKRGEPLVERKLAASLNVSKTPVREALISLARRGLVTATPNRGSFVRAMNPEELHSIYQVRALLEPWAIRQATQNPNPAVIADARAALAEAASHHAIGNRVAAGLANRRFHRVLYSACGNDLAVSILDDLQDQVALGVLSLLWPTWSTWEGEADEHAAILAAAEAGDADLSEQLASGHVTASIRRLAHATSTQTTPA
jgi:DNA-binding GntR family transcriptional regulator